MGDTSVTQLVVEVLGTPDVSPDTSTTQLVVEVLGVAQTECYTDCLGLPFLFTAAEWSSPAWFFEAYFRASVGTAQARLYDRTDAVAVGNSIITTASATLTRVRSAQFALTDGHEYCGQFGVVTGGTGHGLGFRLINI
jgi:hypothetical protein